MTSALTFFTIGYRRWSGGTRPSSLVAALLTAGVDLLVDVRHSPCSSQIDPASNYGPKAMNLWAEADREGIVPLLADAGIEYAWCVELGNPQKNDPEMRVLKDHLAAPPAAGWPVRRGLDLVQGLIVGGRRVALMCACDKFAKCHRKPVAEALLKLLPAGTVHRDLSR